MNFTVEVQRDVLKYLSARDEQAMDIHNCENNVLIRSTVRKQIREFAGGWQSTLLKICHPIVATTSRNMTRVEILLMKDRKAKR